MKDLPQAYLRPALDAFRGSTGELSRCKFRAAMAAVAAIVAMVVVVVVVAAVVVAVPVAVAVVVVVVVVVSSRSRRTIEPAVGL